MELAIGFVIGFAFGVVASLIAFKRKPESPPVTETTPRHRTMWG